MQSVCCCKRGMFDAAIAARQWIEAINVNLELVVVPTWTSLFISLHLTYLSREANKSKYLNNARSLGWYWNLHKFEHLHRYEWFGNISEHHTISLTRQQGFYITMDQSPHVCYSALRIFHLSYLCPRIGGTTEYDMFMCKHCNLEVVTYAFCFDSIKEPLQALGIKY